MDAPEHSGLLQKAQIAEFFYCSYMQVCAELVDDSLVVTRTRDIGRLYSKSKFGKLASGKQLHLDLLEGVFLAGEGKITVFKGKKRIGFEYLVQRAATRIPDFEMKYLLFRDLRKRGYLVKCFHNHEYIHFYIHKQEVEGQKDRGTCYICLFSERDRLNIDKTKKLLQYVHQKQGSLWFALVDEEGDITYYDVSSVNLQGDVTEHRYPRGTGILLENRVVVFDNHLVHDLFDQEFYGKPFGEGLQLSHIEALYLMKKNILSIRKPKGKKPLSSETFLKMIKRLHPDITTRYLVFTDLKNRGMIVKTGFKFGAHFRAYTQKPGVTHAEYLVHVVPKGFTSVWAEISRAVRLAHSVNKDIVFARVDNTRIDYIQFGRLRP